LPSHRTTDLLFVVSAVLWAGLIGWHYQARVRPLDTHGRRSFLAQLFDDSALRERRWTILAPSLITTGPFAPAGTYSTTVARKGDEIREMRAHLDVHKVYRITADTRQRWHIRKGLVVFDGEGTVGDQTFVFRAERQGDFVQVRIWREGKLIHERLVETRDLTAGFSPFLPMKSLEIGDSWKVATVNAVQGGVNRDRIVVEGEEAINFHGRQIMAKLVTCDGRKGVQAWYSPEGEVLRADFRYWMLRLRLELDPDGPGEETDT